MSELDLEFGKLKSAPLQRDFYKLLEGLEHLLDEPRNPTKQKKTKEKLKDDLLDVARHINSLVERFSQDEGQTRKGRRPKISQSVMLAANILAAAKPKEVQAALSSAKIPASVQRAIGRVVAEWLGQSQLRVSAHLIPPKHIGAEGVGSRRAARAAGEEYLSTKQVAVELGMAAGTISNYCGMELLRGLRVGKDWKVSRAEVERFKRKRKKPGRPSKKS